MTASQGCLSVVMPAYKEAATIQAVVNRVLQQTEFGQLVIADDAGARFYGLTDYKPMANASRAALSAAPPPAWVVLSKVDVYDGHGSLREYITTRGLRPEAVFQSFAIYRFPMASPQ